MADRPDSSVHPIEEISLLAAAQLAYSLLIDTHYKCDLTDDAFCHVEAPGEHFEMRSIDAAIVRADRG
jgi:hypothetical protein